MYGTFIPHFANAATVMKAEKNTQEKTDSLIELNENNVEHYFNVSLEGSSFEGKKFVLKYSVSPKNSLYAKSKQSSADLTVKFSIDVYDSKEALTPVQHKDYTVILKKEDNYSRSGKIEIILPSDDIETAYWDYSIASSSGKINPEK